MQQSMCSSDVNHLPPKWKTHVVPSENIVAYYFLLKQKREFQQFINGLGSQVSNMSSCYIIDEMCSAACENDINIYIFDGRGYFKSLLLKILVPKKNLMKKISLLIHLTSQNNAVAKLENRCMFIKCKEGGIWETFYNFFEFLLKKSSMNLIGTQFYVPLVCKQLISNEIKLLHSFCSRFISANTKQTVKSYGSKPSLKLPMQQTGVTTCDLNILNGHGSKPNPLNMTRKRKSINSENDIKVKTMKVSHQFCKKFKCKCHERNKWKVFKQITQCSIINYVDLIKADNAFNDSEFSQISSTQIKICPTPVSLQVYENNWLQFESNENISSKVRVEPSLNSSYQAMNITSEVDLFKTKQIEDEKGIELSNKLCDPDKVTKITSNKTIPYLEKNDSNRQYSLNHNKKNLQEVIERKQNMESSNNILIESELVRIPVLPIPAVISTESNSNLLQGPSMGFQSMSIKNHVNTEHFQKGFQSSSKLNVSSKGFERAPKVDCNMINQQPIGFQTAAGKSLNISEKAILAAQKMFEEVCSQEINLLDNDAGDADLPSTSAFKKPAYPDENYHMDSDFADKFFEEIPFDDKEVEFKPKVDLMESPLPSLNKEKSQVGKVRKSLGGRRSLKPYAMKK